MTLKKIAKMSTKSHISTELSGWLLFTSIKISCLKNTVKAYQLMPAKSFINDWT